MKDIIDNNKFAIIGALVGFIIALLFLTLGFFKTILLLIMTIVGFGVGWYLKKTGLLSKLK
ncbi:DUF2273 domain-containing protein [Carnobacterium divergens]|uniref:DUF2273 domain-containing protein n=1 Tax=Carnobacterium divergens TaxID=2748 RepID=A0AAW8RBB2_CARDV|nr:DUF2273 domain-containing protein [Carnobacterium divergens]MDT1959001.1 DUF2273 domain-containing protein [Carnobacterium divergens]MDT1974969.1 DUF2273 domain-containing protein [Carnobacterium divergens]MDT2012933.1 DUF2273 domain-containing protein [Carnobacterium divergens]